MIPIFSRSWTILRTEGFRSLWFKALSVTLYRRVDVAEKTLHADLPRTVVSQGMEIGLLQSADIYEFVEFAVFCDRATVEKRLAEGQQCVTVRKNGELIHSTWITGGRIRIDYQDCLIQLADDVAYVYESFTSLAWRRQGVSSMRSPVLNDYCLERGYNRRVCVFWPENKAGCLATKKEGYIVVGRLGYFGAGPFKKHFLRYRGSDPPFQLVNGLLGVKAKIM